VRAEPPAPVVAEDEQASPYEPAHGYVDIPLPPRRAEPVRVAAPRPPARRPDDGLRHVAYQCEGGRSLNVVFDDWHDTAKVQSPDEGPVFLRKVGSTQGFRYEDRDLALFGERGEVSFVSGDREPLGCWSPAARRQFSAR
jgi:membrane-bound inhibitor of C-type lysozyme